MTLYHRPMIIDCHTHHLDRQDAIICVAPEDFHPQDDRLYCVGIHPWNADKPFSDKHLEAACADSRTAFIGETGIDKHCGVDLGKQETLLLKHISLSESLCRPLVLHAVKSADRILALRKSLRPTMTWIWHGFRGNAILARQLWQAGIYLSLGEHFNAEAAKTIPADRLLIETDESPLTINEIAAKVAQCRGVSEEEVLQNAAENLYRLYTV